MTLWLIPFGLAILVFYLIAAAVFVSKGGGVGIFRGLGYKAFVAQRYLLVPHPKVTRTVKWMIGIGFLARLACQILFAAGVGAATYHNPLWDLERAFELFLLVVIVGGVLVHSKPALYSFIFGLALSAAGIVLGQMVSRHIVFDFGADGIPNYLAIMILIFVIGGLVIASLAVFFGMLRAFFTFFTTVPIGGVWIGTFALVCVLAVMSGFETDLREKILGSSAHIQITREDGDFTEWRDVKARVDKVPGVLASTPYAVSEVVIAANNNGMNVIIKGIDPKSVGKVTDLVHDLEDKDAMSRLEPLVDDTHDLNVPQTPQPDKPVVDPPPPESAELG